MVCIFDSKLIAMSYCEKVITFRPKDCDVYNYIRDKAIEEKRSMNNWIETHFLKLMESEKFYKKDKKQIDGKDLPTL